MPVVDAYTIACLIGLVLWFVIALIVVRKGRL